MSYPQVVKIFATTQNPDYTSPWQAQTPTTSIGSGVVIGPREILTGAHVVANPTFLRVQKVADPDKVVARLKAVCHDADLALLEVEDASFTEGIRPASIGDLPALGDKVSVVGFPVGGEEVSVTRGVVSRIEVQRYTHSERQLLAVTVDAAINRGNSGGPVFRNNKIAGVAFQSMERAQNIGDIVPASIIRHFLEGIPSGRESTIPGIGISTQNLENPTLRRHLGLENEDSGLLVTAVPYGGSAWGHIQVGDALLEVDGLRVANNGTVHYQGRHRTRYDVIVGHHYVGDEVEVRLMRKGKRITEKLTLKPLRYLVDRCRYDVLPTYFVFGGLVFQPLTGEYLSTWEEWNDAPEEFLHYYYSGSCTEARQEIVTISDVLADGVNVGYEDRYDEVVEMVNGTRPRNMLEFVRLVEASEGIVEIRTSGPGVIMMEMENAKEATERILKRYHVGRDRSVDLDPS